MNTETHICCEKRPARKREYSGKCGDPIPCTTAFEFDAMQDLCRGGHLLLEDGDYATGGSWACRKQGLTSMHGNGPRRCTVRLQAKTAWMPFAEYTVGGIRKQLQRPDTSILNLPGHFEEPHQISGIRFSAKLAVGSDPKLIVNGGINSESPAKVRNVEIAGVRGSWTILETGLAYEAFHIRIVGPGGGSHVADATVIMEENSYGNGITVGHMDPDAPPSIVERVLVVGRQLNHCGLTGSRNVTFRQFHVSGVLHGIFQDTGPMSNCRWTDGVIRTHWCAARFHSHNATETRTSIEIDGVTVFFDLIPANGNGIVLALTHVGAAAEMRGIRCNAYVPAPPASYYEMSTDLSKASLAYEQRIDSPRKGQVNEPPAVKSKATGFSCVATLDNVKKYRVRP